MVAYMVFHLSLIYFFRLLNILSEAVEANHCYLLENWLIKLKCPNILSPQILSECQYFLKILYVRISSLKYIKALCKTLKIHNLLFFFYFYILDLDPHWLEKSYLLILTVSIYLNHIIGIISNTLMDQVSYLILSMLIKTLSLILQITCLDVKK